MMPVTIADFGERYIVRRLSGNDGIRRHLEGLGCLPGSEVTVISSTGGGVILSVKGSRIAIDKSLASRIFV